MRINNLAAILAAGTTMFVAAPAQAQQHDFDIPAGSLRAALDLFGRQSGRPIIYRADDVRGARSAGFRGRASSDRALAAILAGTGFAARTNEAGAIAIVRLTSQAGLDDGAIANGAADQQEIVVTGTNIRGAAPVGSPLSVYRREDIDRTGASSVEQFVRTIPQNFSLTDSSTPKLGNGAENISNSFYGAAINLRGIGNGATLTLLNGRRLPAAGSDGSFVDISMLPFSAVERVEILTDGASAVYGADAVAGVANFILRRDFAGLETSFRYGDSTQGGGQEINASQTAGATWATGGGLITYEFQDRNPLRIADRAFLIERRRPGGPGDDYTLLPAQRRHTLFATVHQDIGTRLELGGDILFSRRTFVNDSFRIGGVVPTRTQGSARQLGGNLNALYHVGPDWTAELNGNYGEIRQRSVEDAPTGTTRFVNLGSTTQIELRAGGPVIALPAGNLRASLGASYRRERFQRDAVQSPQASQPATDLRRSIYSLYGELLVPVLHLPDGPRLDIALAARFDDYSDVGSAVKPKIGVSFVPTGGLVLRGTYAQSFRAPTLNQLDELSAYQLVTVPDPSAADGFTNTIFILGAGNGDLGPERATSFTLGADIEPALAPGLRLSATFFDLDFRNRIAVAPLVGNIFSIYREPGVAPFIDRNVTANRISQIVDNEIFFNSGGPDFLGIDPFLTEAFFDLRPRNFARTKASGIQFSATYRTRIGEVELTPFLAGDYLIRQRFQATSTSTPIDNLNRVFRPVDLRARGGATLSRGGLSSTFTLNYVDGYRNDLVTPAGRVRSWLTADLIVGYRFGDNAAQRALRGLSLSFSATNLFDRDPPFVPSATTVNQFGFDPTNASAVGRALSVQVTKRW